MGIIVERLNSMEKSYITEDKSKRTLVMVALLLFLGGVIFFVSRDQTFHFANKASEATTLDATQASQIVLLKYAEQGATGERIKMRVEVPHEFAFTPESIVSGTSSATKDTPQTFNFTQNEYICHSDMDDDHQMMGYETQLYQDAVSTNMDDQFYITFTSQNGKKYATTLSTAHVCTVLAKDAIQQVTPPTTIDVPTE
jgi:hypothetical protein